MNLVDKLSQCPLIVENILKFLCGRDLSSCSQVCTLWSKLAEAEKRRRISIECFFEIGTGEYNVHFDEGSQFEELAEGCYDFQKQLEGLRGQPQQCLCLITAYSVEQKEKAFPDLKKTTRRKKKKLGFLDMMQHSQKLICDQLLKPHLPLQCETHCISASGIIGCDRNLSISEIEQGAAITGLLLPDFPGVNFEHIPIQSRTKTNFSNLPIKGLLVFLSKRSYTCIRRLVDQCIKSNKGQNFALGGALVDGPCSGIGSCFAISGENVEVASIVISANMTDVKAELEIFQHTGLLDNNCFCFMFTCIEKGIGKYEVANYESNIFHKLYPKVPLFGVFGNGEIGVSHFPNVDLENSDFKERLEMFQLKNCIGAYNTVFVLVSVKQPK